jgi:hypothetical protein
VYTNVDLNEVLSERSQLRLLQVTRPSAERFSLLLVVDPEEVVASAAGRDTSGLAQSGQTLPEDLFSPAASNCESGAGPATMAP